MDDAHAAPVPEDHARGVLMRKLYAAILIGAIAVLIDFLFHYVILAPYMVASNGVVLDYLESPAYFAAKFLIFAVVAYAFLAIGWMQRLFGPWMYGIAASASFGAFYYFYPSVSVGTGSMPLPGKLLWGGIHMGCGVVAAGLYERNAFAVIYGLAILIASAVVLVLFGPMLFAAYPSSTIPGY